MRRIIHGNLVLIAVLASAALAVTSPAHGQLPPPYYNGYGGGYYSSTAGEGYQRGMAARMDAEGNRNLSNSQAAINMTQASSQAIDNRTQATNAYWDRKNIYEQNMAPKKYAQEQEYNKVRARNMLTSLTPDEYNPTTGAVNWPMVCQDDNYAKYRDPLTKLFEQRAQYGELKTSDYLEAKKLVKEFRAAITADKADLPEAPLSQSLRFLLKLNRELDANFT